MFHFSPGTVKETAERQNSRCISCNAAIDPETPESFYYHSFGKGTDTASNCFLLCPECHEKLLHSSLENFDYPSTEHGNEVKTFKSPAVAAILGALFPRMGMLYVGGRFCLLNWGVFILLSFIQYFLVLPTYEAAVAEVVFVNVAFRVYAAILGYKMAKYQTNLLKAYVEENDLDPNFYRG